jgi:hypothetical protein
VVLFVLNATLLRRQARLSEGLLADVVPELTWQLVVSRARNLLVLADPAPERSPESSDQGIVHL